MNCPVCNKTPIEHDVRYCQRVQLEERAITINQLNARIEKLRDGLETALHITNERNRRDKMQQTLWEDDKAKGDG